MTYKEQLIEKIMELTNDEADLIMCYCEQIKAELDRCEDVSLLDRIHKLLKKSNDAKKQG